MVNAFFFFRTISQHFQVPSSNSQPTPPLMGASESDLSSVDTLRDQISALETRLSGISQQHQDFEVWPEAKDGRVLTVSVHPFIFAAFPSLPSPLGPLPALLTPPHLPHPPHFQQICGARLHCRSDVSILTGKHASFTELYPLSSCALSPPPPFPLPLFLPSPIGPVIGKVTSTTALVLLETSKTVDVTMYVSLVDLDVPNGRVIASAKQRCEARKVRITA